MKQKALFTKTLLALVVLAAQACASAPVNPPTYPSARYLYIHVEPAAAVVTVRPIGDKDVGTFTGTVHADDGGALARFNQLVRIPWDVPEWGAVLSVEAEGYVSHVGAVERLNHSDFALPDVTLSPVDVTPTYPRPVPLVAAGRSLLKQTGEPFIWKGLTAFRLVELVASGRADEARNFLVWARSQDASIVRVFTALDAGMFVLTPEAGRAALPTLLEMAADVGLYVEVVALAGTKAVGSGINTRVSMAAHVATLGAIAAQFPNAVIELANENSHASQSSDLVDVPFLLSLRSLIPASVPVSLGSTHGGEDESDIFKDGDFLTIHGDRSDGDFGWRHVRHTNEQRALADLVRKFAVNDEPRRDDLSPDKHLALAVLCRMFNLGDTFHYAAGLQAQIATGSEAAALEARRRGWAAIPANWSGQYQNAGFSNSPVKGFENAVRAYSSVNGGIGYVLVLGANGERLEWDPGWPVRTLLISEGGMRLYRAERGNGRITQ